MPKIDVIADGSGVNSDVGIIGFCSVILIEGERRVISGLTASIFEISQAEWEQVLRINLTGVFLCCKAVLPGMMAQRRGWVINIGSITGKRPLALRTPYATSKLGLVSFTRTLAMEMGPYNITVNNISPGGVNTQRLRDLAAARQALAGREVGGRSLESIAAKTAVDVRSAAALERISEPDDIAGLAVFLCTEDARNITGEDINVSAGMVMY